MPVPVKKSVATVPKKPIGKVPSAPVAKSLKPKLAPALPAKKAKPPIKPAAKADPKRDAIKESSSNRKVVYPRVGMTLFSDNDEHYPDGSEESTLGGLSFEYAKQLLGWVEPADGAKPFKDYLFKDRNGTTVQVKNNEVNRPVYTKLAMRWMYGILKHGWKLNGETIIIGKTGLVLDGQNRLIGFAWAVQEYRNDPAKYPRWEAEPTLNCIVITGIEEDRETVNTINVGKSRSLADAIYASGLFIEADRNDIKTLSRMAGYATSVVWKRTNANATAFSPYPEHADLLDFLERHPRLLECVRYSFEENGGGEARLDSLISSSYAAGLLYLMATSATSDIDAYIEAPSEENLDFSQFDRACEFITLLSGHASPMKHLIAAFVKLNESESGGSYPEREALILQAWNVVKDGSPLTAADLVLEYEVDGSGFRMLLSYPTVGGVDCYTPID